MPTNISCGLCCEGNDLFVFIKDDFMIKYKTLIYETWKKPISDLYRHIKEMGVVDKLGLIHLNATFSMPDNTIAIFSAYINSDRMNGELEDHIRARLNAG